MDLIRKRLRLLSNYEHSPREQVNEWGSYEVDKNADELEAFTDDIDLVRKLFVQHTIKWYLVYEEVLNITTAQLTSTMVESAAHEEIPPIEFNLKAKNIDPKLVFKPIKLDLDW